MSYSEPQRTQIKRRNPWAVWGLSVVTLGIYFLFWYYTINREIGEAFPQRKVNPVNAVLAVTVGALVVVPPFVSIFNTGDRIRNAQRDSGLEATSSPIVGLLLSFVLGLNIVYHQTQLNAVADKSARLASN